MKPGAVIAARYTVEKELGRGGMGAVFAARDSKFGGLVALKVASASGAALDEFKERFAREARIGHRLGRTEGFVRALDWGEIEGTSLYLAMDLVEGATALDLVGGSLAERLDRLARAASIVQTAHALGVVHRDLKPQNFLVDASGRIFLADFGLAKSREIEEAPHTQLTRTGLGMGTPAYMPPEQFEDARGADERADVYALGVMLFVALTGELPYDGSATAILQRQMRVQDGREKPPRPGTLGRSVPPALDELCARAIELDRSKRLGSARLLVEGLAQGLARSVVAAPPPSAAAPTSATLPASAGVRVVATPPTPPPSSHVRRVAPPPAPPTPLALRTPPPPPAPPPLPEPPAKPGSGWSTPLLVTLGLGVLGAMLLCCVLAGIVGQLKPAARSHVPAHLRPDGLFVRVEGHANSTIPVGTMVTVHADDPSGLVLGASNTSFDGSYSIPVAPMHGMVRLVVTFGGDPPLSVETLPLR